MSIANNPVDWLVKNAKPSWSVQVYTTWYDHDTDGNTDIVFEVKGPDMARLPNMISDAWRNLPGFATYTTITLCIPRPGGGRLACCCGQDCYEDDWHSSHMTLPQQTNRDKIMPWEDLVHFIRTRKKR